MPRKPLSNVLIKPAGPDCNLGCRYCFYLCKDALFPSPNAHRMSEETLEILTRKLCGGGSATANFCWQGGEPTLMGLDFFRRARELQRQYAAPNQQAGNALQTNGWVINEEWARFLRENRFLVGLSLDGPAHVHDRYRLTRDGRPTHDRVEAAAQLLLEERVDTNALVVVNDYSVQHGAEIYNYLREQGFQFMQFIPCLPIPGAEGSDAPAPPDPRAYGDFLIETFDCWRRDFQDGWPTISLRHLESLFSSYVNGPALECCMARVCGDYVVVEHTGEVFSCDFFVEPRWRLGHVAEDSLEELLNSERQREFGERKANLPESCAKCRWLSKCRGGCPADREEVAGGRRMRLCAGWRRFLEHAHPVMQRLADRWLARQREEERRRQQMARLQSARGSAPRGRVSRNAPCPCGSGAKFKNCCGKRR